MIYVATHLTLDRPVQVHILRRPDWVSASRFQLSARLAARLNHPNLVSVIDAGHDEQYGDYLVTPILEARPLNEVLQEGPLEPQLAIRVVRQVATALDYLHSQQVIHRDVQPATMLLTADGQAYLGNLSLAASPDAPDLSSVDGSDYLTPYSAPEQRLDQSMATPALDVYGLGATLYHMLTGDDPPLSVDQLVSLAVVDPSLGAADRVIQRMLAEDPEERFASPGEAVTALRRTLRSHIHDFSEERDQQSQEPIVEWIENPLERLLAHILEQEEQQADMDDADKTDAPPYREALGRLEEYVRRSRSRADTLHRSDTIRRLLSRWSRKGFFRRHPLGQMLDLEELVSYNIYLYELRTLYETRTRPEAQQRIQHDRDVISTQPVPDVWEVGVPESPPFSDVRPQELVLPHSTTLIPCTDCRGTGEVACKTCLGNGMIERKRPGQHDDQGLLAEKVSETCPDCRGYGMKPCPTCEGRGKLVQEQVFVWSRHARLWENTDDLEGLPGPLMEKRVESVCRVSINPFEGDWHRVPTLAELFEAAVADLDDETHLRAAELTIRAVPLTEVDYRLNEKAQRLTIVGFSNDIAWNWSLLNPDRIALAVVAVLLVLVLLLVGLSVLV